MKYVNYGLLLFISVVTIIFASAWTFNHLNAWVGFVVFGVGSYLVVLLISKIIKGNKHV